MSIQSGFIGFLFCLLLSPIALSQSKPIFESKGAVVFPDGPERIMAHSFLDPENKLLVVGQKTIRLFDVISAKFVDSRPIETPEYFGEDNPRVISPDGRKMLVFGNYGISNKQNKIKRPAAIWDLDTGKRIAVLDGTTRPVRAGLWSRNGKTLVTSSDKYAPLMVDDTSVEVAFWDGETFRLQNSLPAERINWWYLTADGDKCLFSTGPVKNLLFIVKYLDNNGGPIRVWDIASGKIEATIPETGSTGERRVRAISVSANEKFLMFVAQKPKTKNTERRLAVWGIENTDDYRIKSKYEVRPDPNISEYGGSFSPDGKYFALVADKALQIYETSTGQKRFELATVKNNPTLWLNDNKILLFDRGTRMTALETATGKQLYEQPMVYEEYSYTEGSGDSSFTYAAVSDSTTIVPNRSRDLLLTYSKQYVKVLDSVTGDPLQTLVSPPMDNTKKKPRLSDKPLVSRATWSGDGKTLLVLSYDKESVSVWRLAEN